MGRLSWGTLSGAPDRAPLAETPISRPFPPALFLLRWNRSTPSGLALAIMSNPGIQEGSHHLSHLATMPKTHVRQVTRHGALHNSLD